MISLIRHYLLAVQYFTRIPITGKLAEWVGYSSEALQSSAAHFPGIGILVGSFASLILYGTFQLLPASPFTPLVCSFLSAFASILLTGAFHEDGLADSADGIGGSSERNRTLEIMKDSRIGTYGAVALILVLGSKISLVALLLSLNPLLALMTVLLGHTVSRWIPLLAMKLLPPIIESPDSKSKPLIEKITMYHLTIGTSWLLGVLLILNHYRFVQNWSLGLLLALMTGFIFTRTYFKRLGGYTGDCLGATQQLTEISFYVGTLFFIGKAV